MPRLADQALPLQHWTVLSLRPRGQHAGLRAAATRSGARLLALSPIAIDTPDDSDARQSLAAALAADIVLFTSPNAVRAAAALAPLQARRGQHWLAVGAGTRRALARCGVDALAPARMDSEGLLGMPQLVEAQGKRIGLVTAPGARRWKRCCATPNACCWH
jgi:uroporphyrinogen-III synthase